MALRGNDPAERERALETIANVYWRPVYTYIRLRWNRDSDDARDLTQAFFLQVLEKDFFAAYDRDKARFRTFLRVCLDRFVQREESAAGRQKRGGDATIVPIDLIEAEESLPSSRASSPGYVFEREWARSVLELATEQLRRHCESARRDSAFRLFEQYDLNPAAGGVAKTYAQLGTELGTTVDEVTNQLAYARREFRRAVLDLLRDMTVNEEEFRDEARALLGISV